MKAVASGVTCLLAVIASSTACVIPYNAQSGEVVADTTADYRQLLLAAQADQRAFEEWRRHHLPIRWGPTTTRPRCQEAVGRFCLEEGTGYGAWIDIPSDSLIARERAKLIRALDDVARRIPSDDWVVGQLVRYTVEAGRLAEALTHAQGCEGTRWWCAALLGYATYRGVDAAAAEPAFDLALRAMPQDERNRWTDPDVLLDPEEANLVAQLNDVSRAAFVHRFWRLSDPFMTRPGNEILMEHLARRVELQFQWEAGPMEGLEWGRDHDDVVVRYGSSPKYIAALGARFLLFKVFHHIGPPRGVPDLMGHYTMPGLDLLPPVDAVLAGREGIWDPIEKVPRAGYDVELGDSAATWLAPLAHQVAVFPRGNEAMLVAAFDLPSHGLLGVEGSEGALAILPSETPLGDPEVIPARVSEGIGVVLMRTESRPTFTSLEAFIPERHIAGRVRGWLNPQPLEPGQRAISDILLVRSSGSRPESLQEAATNARGSNRVAAGEEVAIYWEMYGLDPEADPVVTMSLRFLPGESTGVRRLGEIVGVVDEDEFAEVRWQEEVTGESVMPRSVSLTIPELREGTHTLELTMEVAGDTVPTRAEIVVASRPVEPLPPSSMTRRPQLLRTLCNQLDDRTPVGNLGNLGAFEEYRDVVEGFFDNNTLEPPPCPTELHDVLYETGHGY